MWWISSMNPFKFMKFNTPINYCLVHCCCAFFIALRKEKKMRRKFVSRSFVLFQSSQDVNGDICWLHKIRFGIEIISFFSMSSPFDAGKISFFDAIFTLAFFRFSNNKWRCINSWRDKNIVDGASCKHVGMEGNADWVWRSLKRGNEGGNVGKCNKVFFCKLQS